MSEQGETECPRCGEPAVGTRFCPSCGLKLLGSSPVMQAPPAWEVNEVSTEPAGPPLADLRIPAVVPASIPVVESRPPDWWAIRDADDAPGKPSVDVVPEPVVDVVPEPVVDAVPEPVVDAVPEPVVDAVPEPVVDTEPELTFAPAPELSEPTVETPRGHPEDDTERVTQHHVPRPMAEPWTPPRSRGRRVAFLCLAALIALVVFVPGRRLHR
jgi:hypothetical protein